LGRSDSCSFLAVGGRGTRLVSPFYWKLAGPVPWPACLQRKFGGRQAISGSDGTFGSHLAGRRSLVANHRRGASSATLAGKLPPIPTGRNKQRRTTEIRAIGRAVSASLAALESCLQNGPGPCAPSEFASRRWKLEILAGRGGYFSCRDLRRGPRRAIHRTSGRVAHDRSNAFHPRYIRTRFAEAGQHLTRRWPTASNCGIQRTDWLGGVLLVPHFEQACS